MAHILIVESNTPELVAESRSQGRLSEADNYLLFCARLMRRCV